MNSSTIKRLVENELARGESFCNYHGITPENLRSFLVEPFPVRTEPDDLETERRDMWVVLQTCLTPTKGWVVVYDPYTGEWGVAEHVSDGDYILNISTPSLAEALTGM